MLPPSKVSKENFRLLDLSSEEESEDLHLEIIPSRKKKITRRDRSKSAIPRPTNPSIAGEVRCAVKWAMQGTLLLWLLMLTWMCARLYGQMSVMKTNISQVSTSSDSIGDALQGCHTAAKVLQSNATDLSNRLTKLEQEHLELAKRVEKAIGDLTAVSDQLAAAPKLADTPRRLAELQRTVADFGSQVKGFETSLQTAHNQLATASSGVEEMKTLLHKLETKTNETTANVTANMRRDQELTLQMVALNTTLGAKLDALQARIEVSQNASSTANTGVGSAPAPRPAPSAAPAAAPAPAAQPPPPPPPAPTPQGPQAKPSVLAANQ